MDNFFLVRFKKTFSTAFRRDSVHIFDIVNLRTLPKKDVDIIPFDTIEPFNDQENLLLIRSGGIGDIIAYSVLHDAAPNVVMVTQEQYRPYIKLWHTPPQFKRVGSPILFASSLQSLLNQLKHYGRLNNSIDDIEEGSRENWYDIIYRSANLPAMERRPLINRPDIPIRKGCLVIHKSSVPNRNADLDTMVRAMQPYYPLTIAAEQTWTANQYIEALASYEFCITTDTSAIHLREGFGMPAIGVYGTFDKDCRTSGHIYTDSVQSDRHCSPCQVHNKIPCRENKGTNYSPCLSGEDLIIKIQNAYENRTKVQRQVNQDV